MAHPNRMDNANKLREQLENCPMSIDQGCGIIANCRNAWTLRNVMSDFHFVIQDDAILCREFIPRVNQLVRSLHHRQAFSLYMGRRPEMAEEQRKAASRGWWNNSLRWGVAVGLKSSLIPKMLKAYDTHTIQKDDARIKRFLISQRIDVYYPLPSLVEHMSGPSLVGDPGENRRAYFFLDNATPKA